MLRKKYISLLMAIALLISLLAPMGAQVSAEPGDGGSGSSIIRLDPVADAHVRGRNNSENPYGTSDKIEVKLAAQEINDATRHGFLKFDISQLNEEAREKISSAKLHLRVVSQENANDVSLKLHPVIDHEDVPWSEATITYDNMPGYDEMIIAETVVSAGSSWYEWDLTSYLKNTPDTDLAESFTLRGTVFNGSRKDFASKEHSNAEYRPYLEIEFVETVIPTAGVTLDVSELTLTAGESAALTATVSPENATYKNVVWTTSDSGVATVSASGLVAAVAAGTATITVTTEDGEHSASSEITVESAEPSEFVNLTVTNKAAHEAAASTGGAGNGSDGNYTTFWKIANSYLANNNEVWYEVRLKQPAEITEVNFTDLAIPLNDNKITGYTISFIDPFGNVSPTTYDQTSGIINGNDVHHNVSVVAKAARITVTVPGTSNFNVFSEMEIIGKITEVAVAEEFYLISGTTELQNDEWVNVAEDDTLQLGAKARLSGETDLSDATIEDVVFTSSNPEMVVIDDNGLVTVASIGVYYIDASYGGKTTRLWIAYGDVDYSNTNMAYNKPVVSSSYCGTECNNAYNYHIVDGDIATTWIADANDYLDDNQAWVYIDLGKEMDVNTAQVLFSSTDVLGYDILVSSNATDWKEVYTSAVKVDAERAVFVDQTARYVKVNAYLKAGQKPILSEVELYFTDEPKTTPVEFEFTPPINLADLEAIQLFSQEKQIVNDEWISLEVGNSIQLITKAKLATQIELVDIKPEIAAYTSNMPNIVSVDSNGLVTVLGKGAVYIDVNYGGSNGKTTRFWIDSYGNDVDPATINLALKKPVTSSSFCGSTCNGAIGTYDYYVNDGVSSTYWRPLGSDVTGDGQAHVIIDLGKETTFNKAVMNINNDGNNRYDLLVSNDGLTWIPTYAVKFLIGRENIAIFNKQTARYIKFNIYPKDVSQPALYEIELYNTDEEAVDPIANGIEQFQLLDTNDQPYEYKVDVLMRYPEEKHLRLKTAFTMYEQIPDDYDNVEISFETDRPEVATIDNEGNVTALSRGTTIVTATAKFGPHVVSTKVIIVVEDPTVYYVTTSLSHSGFKSEIGEPAALQSGETVAPDVIITPHVNLTADIELLRGNELLKTIPTKSLTAGEAVTILLELDTNDGIGISDGQYIVNMKFTTEDGEVWYDHLYFTIQNNGAISALKESIIAYPGVDGKMVYVPDYKGNRIMDFSTSGYKGGGVKLPDVQASVLVKPIAGDNTKIIQNAIDYVAKLPLGKDGFRGTVLLDEGTFNVAGRLYINTSGIVIRGKGDGADGGTTIHATGNRENQETIINVGDSETVPVLLEDTATKIIDLYVPVGERTFRVEDASNFAVGDTIFVRRHGNSSWIHEINMDVIVEFDAGVVQWEPFDIEMDRVITHIEGNEITVDASVANAIELIWGGGEIVKYDDSNRLENIGIENMKVTNKFDPTVIGIQNDAEYYADEDHAWTFVALNNVKNAWVRNIHAKHLANSLAFTGRNSKWVTLQDNIMEEHVSVITGSRRYSYFYTGQLALGQRLVAESARHAFIWNRNSPGPNVFLDSESSNDYNRSEPHHRYSTGGLFDNVEGRLNVMDRARYGTGHGWAGANFVLWNARGKLELQSPPTATNWSIGFVGDVLDPQFITIEVGSDKDKARKLGYMETFEKEGKKVGAATESLYKAQLKDRLGDEAVANLAVTTVGGEELDKPIYNWTPIESSGSTPPPSVVIELPIKIETDANGKKVAKVSPTNEQVQDALNSGTIKLGLGANAADVIQLELPASELAKKPGVTLKVEGGIADYNLPLAAINLQLIADELGGTLDQLQLILEIAKVDAVEDAKWNREDATPVSSFISFHLYAKIGDKLVELNDFDHYYVERVIPIESENFSPDNATGATIDPATGQISFVPTRFEQRGGKWFAILKRNSNSIYMVLEHQKSFEDIVGHWASKEIEQMASKFLLNGVTDQKFDPNGDITRVQLIAMLVRGLGLSGSSAAQADFVDVKQSAWYASDVAVAVAAGLVEGYADNSLRPDNKVTRNEMVTMLHHAMLYVDPKLANVNASAALTAFTDRNDIPAWAATSAGLLTQKDIIKGKQQDQFAGNDSATRAEAAVILNRALKSLGFL